MRPLDIPIHKAPEEPLPSLSREIGWSLEIIFLVVAVFLFLLGRTPAWKSLIDNLSINFVAVVLEALPFMLIGSLAGGLIEVFVPVTLVERVFGRRTLFPTLIAGGFGLLLPVCECAIVPVVRRLLGKGVPFGCAVTFLLAGPIVNPIVAWSTATAYAWSWPMVLLRLGSGYLIAVSIGLLLGRLFAGRDGVLPEIAAAAGDSCGCRHDHGQAGTPLPSRLRHALEHAGEDFFSVGRYLVIGAFIAALLRSSVPVETFTGLSDAPWLAIMVMMAMAVALNLCSEADAFIAASFRGLLPGSAQLAFMVLGPMLDIKLLLMYLGTFRKRVIVALCLAVPLSVLLAMLAVEYFLPPLI